MIKENNTLLIMTHEANSKLQILAEKCLDELIDFFKSPHSDRKEMLKEARLAGNLISAFAKIYQADTGHALTILMAARGAFNNPVEWKKYVFEKLPHLRPHKELKNQ